jgi:phosphatidylserine/phosphatidylglycerophosphate/cardiolipin synthase-like enzyme
MKRATSHEKMAFLRLLATSAIVAFSFLSSFLSMPDASASDRPAVTPRTQLPWRELSPDGVRELSDSHVETQVRLELIRRAKKSIEIVQYLQGNDTTVAMPLLSALRDAANRGVQVRFATSFMPSVAYDPLITVGAYLTGKSTLVPIQYLVFTPHREWGTFDAIHEKLIIVDGKWVITGGRAYGEKFLSWLDDGFFLKGTMARDAERIFERIWYFTRAHNHLFGLEDRDAASEHGFAEPFKHYESPASIALTPEQVLEAAELYRWMESPASGNATVRGRILHFDYVQQLWMKNFPRETSDRLALFDDPVLNAVMERVARPETRDVMICSMSLMLHPRFKRVLIDAAHRGVKIRILTDSKSSAGSVAPLALNFKYALPDMHELLLAGVQISALEANPSKHAWAYLHKKLALVDDDVFMGSHNFNLPSTLYNDEAEFEIEDPTLAASLRARLEAQMALVGRPLNASEVQDEMQSGLGFVRSIERWLGEGMLPLF